LASIKHYAQRNWQWLAVSVWAMILLVLSTVSSRRLPKIESWSDLIGTDKLAHALVYAVFAVLLYLPLRNWRISAGWSATLLSALFGASMEFLQASLSTGRAFELADMLANSVGAVIGTLGIRWWLGRKTKQN
jgi:VanZ family protein